ncbi:MAG: T9SS type A sorting domain-containing protein [Bacteroidales bacterium]|nr:T9SS type A sorting domain-containing protein [Bacteroidales bacterium]
MKTLQVSLFFVILIFSKDLIAQNSFENLISKHEDQIINKVIQDNEGNFIMIGRIENTATLVSDGYLIKIDSYGNIIQEVNISSVDNLASMFFNVHLFNDHYYILGAIQGSGPDFLRIWYLKLNSNLEIEEERFMNTPQNRWISHMNSKIDSDTNIIITGYTTSLDGIYTYDNNAYFYKMNLAGDSLNSKFYTSFIPLHFSFDIIESTDSSKYYAFVSHFTNIFGVSGQILTMNKNLDSIAINPIPMQVYDFYSPVYLNQDTIIICGKRGAEPPNDYMLNVVTITESFELVDYNMFKKVDLREHPAMFDGVSKNGNNIYVGGTSNLDYANPFWSTFDSWFHLIKINPDISPIWEYWYGGDAYYHLYNILATNDGGCIMVGTRYDYKSQNQERDIYIAKVNSEGLIVWTQEIPIGRQETTIYPNPGLNRINIKTDNKELTFELINLNGQYVIRENVNNLKTINTGFLNSGIYFYRLIDNENEILETGKWIKK